MKTISIGNMFIIYQFLSGDIPIIFHHATTIFLVVSSIFILVRCVFGKNSKLSSSSRLYFASNFLFWSGLKSPSDALPLFIFSIVVFVSAFLKTKKPDSIRWIFSKEFSQIKSKLWKPGIRPPGRGINASNLNSKAVGLVSFNKTAV